MFFKQLKRLIPAPEGYERLVIRARISLFVGGWPGFASLRPMPALIWSWHAPLGAFAPVSGAAEHC